MSTWLVTGGAGFIGSNFVRAALESTAARVVVLDKLTYAGRLQNLASIAQNPRYSFVEADIADRTAVSAVFREHRPTAVVNLAAESHVDRSIDGPTAFVNTNIVGTFELLEASRQLLSQGDEAARRAFRFLHVSTDEVSLVEFDDPTQPGLEGRGLGVDLVAVQRHAGFERVLRKP